MRDPARIARICKKLRIIWEASPDQRLGQLVENLSGLRSSPLHGVHAVIIPPDLWNIEDEEWEEKLDRELNAQTKI